MPDLRRFASVDALRGLTVAAMLLVNDAGDWSHVYAPLEHAAWNGCTPADLVFPFFLFIVGVSIELSVTPRLSAAAGTAALQRAVLQRALRIVALGLALNLIAHWSIGERGFRVMGVLQRIGLCYAAAGFAAIHLGRRAQWCAIGAILIGYWLALAFGGALAPQANLADRIDNAILGRYAYLYDPATGLASDPEGILSTLPALATTLLGLRAGAWLRSGDSTRLLMAGVVCLLLGALWSPILPFNKQLWTSSYVLWTGGMALLALALAHQLIDRRGWPALGRSFGVNAIAAYAGSWLMVCVLEACGASQSLYRAAFADWMTPRFGPYLPSLAYAVVITAFWWLLMWGFARRGWYLKI